MAGNTYVNEEKSLKQAAGKQSGNQNRLNINKLLTKFIKNQPVLAIATLAMLLTCTLVPIDAAYLGYFNMRTLATLFCTLAVVNAFAHIHTFEIISKNIVLKLHNLRNAILGLVFITFFGSMLLANDMALLTFLPLGFYVLNSTDNKKAMAFTFIMQNIAANLGGMVTPFGNPQNLYLYSYFQIETWEFVKIMLPSFLGATVLIIICCLFVKPTHLTLKNDEDYVFDKKNTLIYAILFVASILIVFRIVPYTWGTVVITLALFLLDKKSIKEVNYPLLATFCVFFVFSGNMARIPAVSAFFEYLLPKNTLLFGILSCQFISNVPSAVLLSHFTTDYASLLPAVNIGGCGTLIASLASLITFSEFKKHNPDQVKSYVIKFSIINFSFVSALFILQSLIG
ncbi:SLC13 family permease [Cellulosilyticum ruminicola]|uniref:SLC13 family permease n=1 Tax=Cellulosilyticum ruminicola TaxID=425254 RepID=UPI0009FA4102|nr:SLC13 family permease [Cellulosilyticum ruminicola]